MDFPSLAAAATAGAGGIKGLSSVLGHLVHWRKFFDIYNSSPETDKVRLLTHSGHGSVSYLLSDIPRVAECSP